jgi:formylglycine-generating enzyme required for sulfatase activity
MEFIWAAIGADALNPGQLNEPGNLTDWWAGKELELTPAECAAYSQSPTVRGEVGRLASNVLGLYDLNGNAQEIMWDRSKSTGGGKNPWPSGQLTDWVNDTDNATRNRMTKGGSSSSALANIKNLYFNDAIMPFQAQYDANGFRVAINEPAN